MTIDPKQPLSFGDDIISLHNLGFRINGTDFAEGLTVDWDNIGSDFRKEMDKLLNFYRTNDLPPAPIIGLWVGDCVADNRTEPKKWCGVGTKMVAYDTDGKPYPCTYFSPLTFSEDKLKEISSINFSEIQLINDGECQN